MIILLSIAISFLLGMYGTTIILMGFVKSALNLLYFLHLYVTLSYLFIKSKSSKKDCEDRTDDNEDAEVEDDDITNIIIFQAVYAICTGPVFINNDNIIISVYGWILLLFCGAPLYIGVMYASLMLTILTFPLILISYLLGINLFGGMGPSDCPYGFRVC